jgi:hypothetical protein
LGLRDFISSNLKNTLYGLTFAMIFLNASIIWNWDLFERSASYLLSMYQFQNGMETHEFDELFIVIPFLIACMVSDLHRYITRLNDSHSKDEMKLKMTREIIRSFYRTIHNYHENLIAMKSDFPEKFGAKEEVSRIENSILQSTLQLKDLFTPNSYLEQQIMSDLMDEEMKYTNR